MTSIRTSVSLVALFLMVGFFPKAGHASLTELETSGQTYEIVEPHFLNDIKERASKADWQKHVNEDIVKKKVEEYEPPDLMQLPTAAEDRSRLVDMTYELDVDIDIPNPDTGQTMRFPKGYRINPLEYTSYSKIIVVINGSDQKQIDWFLSTPYAEDPRTMLLLSEGRYMDIMKGLNRPVYFLQKLVGERLQLEFVPSVAVQNGYLMQVTEFSMEKKPEAIETAGKVGEVVK